MDSLHTNVMFTKAEVSKLNEVKAGKGFLFKTLSVTVDGIEHAIGSISVSPKTVVDQHMIAVRGKIFEIQIKIAAHIGTPIIKSSLIMEYYVVKSNIDKVLFGEHVIVNTIDGSRLYITFVKGNE